MPIIDFKYKRLKYLVDGILIQNILIVQDLQSKRRERRRERNKLSAQAYRKRRRNQSAKDQEVYC